MRTYADFQKTVMTVEAGLKTAEEFTDTQRLAAIHHLQAQQLQKPSVRLNPGGVVVVSLRTKSRSVIASVKVLRSVELDGRKVRSYKTAAMELAKADIETITHNLTAVKLEQHEKLEETQTEWTNDWLEKNWRVFAGTQGDLMSPLLVANASTAFSLGWNSLMATLMMEAMEETEEEGQRLCFANRAKMFHAYAEQMKLIADETFGDAMEVKVVML
jgi:hypothetical protein